MPHGGFHRTRRGIARYVFCIDYLSLRFLQLTCSSFISIAARDESSASFDAPSDSSSSESVVLITVNQQATGSQQIVTRTRYTGNSDGSSQATSADSASTTSDAYQTQTTDYSASLDISTSESQSAGYSSDFGSDTKGLVTATDSYGVESVFTSVSESSASSTATADIVASTTVNRPASQSNRETTIWTSHAISPVVSESETTSADSSGTFSDISLENSYPNSFTLTTSQPSLSTDASSTYSAVSASPVINSPEFHTTTFLSGASDSSSASTSQLLESSPSQTTLFVSHLSDFTVHSSQTGMPNVVTINASDNESASLLFQSLASEASVRRQSTLKESATETTPVTSPQTTSVSLSSSRPDATDQYHSQTITPMSAATNEGARSVSSSEAGLSRSDALANSESASSQPSNSAITQPYVSQRTSDGRDVSYSTGQPINIDFTSIDGSVPSTSSEAGFSSIEQQTSLFSKSDSAFLQMPSSAQTAVPTQSTSSGQESVSFSANSNDLNAPELTSVGTSSGTRSSKANVITSPLSDSDLSPKSTNLGRTDLPWFTSGVINTQSQQESSGGFGAIIPSTNSVGKIGSRPTNSVSESGGAIPLSSNPVVISSMVSNAVTMSVSVSAESGTAIGTIQSSSSENTESFNTSPGREFSQTLKPTTSAATSTTVDFNGILPNSGNPLSSQSTGRTYQVSGTESFVSASYLSAQSSRNTLTASITPSGTPTTQNSKNGLSSAIGTVDSTPSSNGFNTLLPNASPARFDTSGMSSQVAFSGTNSIPTTASLHTLSSQNHFVSSNIPDSLFSTHDSNSISGGMWSTTHLGSSVENSNNAGQFSSTLLDSTGRSVVSITSSGATTEKSTSSSTLETAMDGSIATSNFIASVTGNSVTGRYSAHTYASSDDLGAVTRGTSVTGSSMQTGDVSFAASSASNMHLSHATTTASSRGSTSEIQSSATRSGYTSMDASTATATSISSHWSTETTSYFSSNDPSQSTSQYLSGLPLPSLSGLYGGTNSDLPPTTTRNGGNRPGSGFGGLNPSVISSLLNTASPTNTQSAALAAERQATTNKIVGGVIGSVAGAALLGLLAFYFLAKKRNKHPPMDEITTAVPATSSPGYSGGYSAIAGTSAATTGYGAIGGVAAGSRAAAGSGPVAGLGPGANTGFGSSAAAAAAAAASGVPKAATSPSSPSSDNSGNGSYNTAGGGPGGYGAAAGLGGTAYGANTEQIFLPDVSHDAELVAGVAAVGAAGYYARKNMDHTGDAVDPSTVPRAVGDTYGGEITSNRDPFNDNSFEKLANSSGANLNYSYSGAALGGASARGGAAAMGGAALGGAAAGLSNYSDSSSFTSDMISDTDTSGFYSGIESLDGRSTLDFDTASGLRDSQLFGSGTGTSSSNGIPSAIMAAGGAGLPWSRLRGPSAGLLTETPSELTADSASAASSRFSFIHTNTNSSEYDSKTGSKAAVSNHAYSLGGHGGVNPSDGDLLFNTGAATAAAAGAGAAVLKLNKEEDNDDTYDRLDPGSVGSVQKPRDNWFSKVRHWFSGSAPKESVPVSSRNISLPQGDVIKTSVNDMYFGSDSVTHGDDELLYAVATGRENPYASVYTNSSEHSSSSFNFPRGSGYTLPGLSRWSQHLSMFYRRSQPLSEIMDQPHDSRQPEMSRKSQIMRALNDFLKESRPVSKSRFIETGSM